jgi:hypothetical protein
MEAIRTYSKISFALRNCYKEEGKWFFNEEPKNDEYCNSYDVKFKIAYFDACYYRYIYFLDVYGHITKYEYNDVENIENLDMIVKNYFLEIFTESFTGKWEQHIFNGCILDSIIEQEEKNKKEINYYEVINYIHKCIISDFVSLTKD